jgi:hypothetical protein
MGNLMDYKYCAADLKSGSFAVLSVNINSRKAKLEQRCIVCSEILLTDVGNIKVAAGTGP